MVIHNSYIVAHLHWLCGPLCSGCDKVVSGGEGVAHGYPLLLYQTLEARDGAEVRVHHELGQRGHHTREVPSSLLCKQNGLPFVIKQS